MGGKKIPGYLNSFWHQRATIRGIRTSSQFAMSLAITELCSSDRSSSGDDSRALFSRARNARLITSDIIPDIESSIDETYCIWYLDLATPETYREVARRYPSIRYKIGRAYATAEYIGLYKELDPLPDVSIAEEAREIDKDAQIYRIIISEPQRYTIIDDLTRSVNLDRKPYKPLYS